MPVFAFPSIPCPGRAVGTDLRDGECLGICYGPGQSAREPSCTSGKSKFALLFSLWLPGPTPDHTKPGLLPLSGVPARGWSAPPLLFRVQISLQPELYPSLRRRRARRGTRPASPFRFGPKRVLEPILGLAGAARWALSSCAGLQAPIAKGAAGPSVRTRIPAVRRAPVSPA